MDIKNLRNNRILLQNLSANLTILSLINIEECDIPQQIVNSKVYIQLL